MTKKTYLAKIRNEFPQVKFKKSRLISRGWDHDVMILDDQWIFRFPKRKEYIQTRFRAEVELLKYLKGKVNIPIPDYMYLAKNKTFGGYKMLKGREMRPYLLKKLSWEKRRAIAKQIGKFLSVLHSIPVKTAEDAGFKNPKEGHWYSRNAVRKRFNKIKKIVFPKLNRKEIAWITQQFETYLNLPSQQKEGVVHGDFVPGHILFDPQKGKVTGIIDFADVEIGDPELEYGGLWGYGATFVKEIGKHHTPPATPEILEKSKFPMRTYMVWEMARVILGDDVPVTFKICRERLHQRMKASQTQQNVRH